MFYLNAHVHWPFNGRYSSSNSTITTLRRTELYCKASKSELFVLVFRLNVSYISNINNFIKKLHIQSKHAAYEQGHHQQNVDPVVERQLELVLEN